jgi:hypothetical protein
LPAWIGQSLPFVEMSSALAGATSASMLTDMSDANSIFIVSSAAALPPAFGGRQCIGPFLRHHAASCCEWGKIVTSSLKLLARPFFYNDRTVQAL